MEEEFRGNKLNVSHFHIFGTKFHCHVSRESRKKLEPTTKNGIFVSYSDTS